MIDPRFYSDTGPLSLIDIIDGLSVDLPDAKFSDDMISAVSALANSQPGDICFLKDKKQVADLTQARATACFVPKDLASAVSAQHIIPLISDHPRAHFSRVMDKLVTQKRLDTEGAVPRIADSARVHGTAVLGAGVVIEAGARIGPYTVLGPGVHIGKNTDIGPHVSIECAVIGADCVIKASSVIGGRGFGVDGDAGGLIDLAHIGRVLIGDRVAIGAQCCVDRGQIGDTVLGDDVKLDNFVQVAHNVHIGARTMIAAKTGISGSCHIGTDVLMGGGVGMADHLSVGNGARLAAYAGVMHDVPAGEMWSGVPALPIRDHMKIVAMTRRMAKPKPKSEPQKDRPS